MNGPGSFDSQVLLGQPMVSVLFKLSLQSLHAQDTTLHQFKRQLLCELRPCDEITYKLTRVDVILGLEKLEDDASTLVDVGISAGAEVGRSNLFIKT